jgi:hypothetical protein
VVSTEVPGFWFQEFSGKNVTAQTDPTVQRMEIAEAVLTLSYELEHSQTMLKAYQAKGDTLDEFYVSIDEVWERASFSSGSGDFLYYTLNGVRYEVPLNQLSKSITFSNTQDPMSITFQFSNDELALTKTITAVENSYRFNTNWTLTPLRADVKNASLYLTTLFDLQYKFEVADIPGLLNWINPYDAPAAIVQKAETWAVASFAGVNLKDRYLGVYDDTNQLGYAFYFKTLPEWGNIGSGANRQLDAIRFQYNFDNVAAGQTVSASYDTLTLSKSSYSQLSRNTLHGLLDYQTQVKVQPRCFGDYLKADNVGFIVYDRNELDPQVINSRILQLVYSNDRYVIFKILK